MTDAHVIYRLEDVADPVAHTMVDSFGGMDDSQGDAFLDEEVTGGNAEEMPSAVVAREDTTAPRTDAVATLVGPGNALVFFPNHCERL